MFFNQLQSFKICFFLRSWFLDVGMSLLKVQNNIGVSVDVKQPVVLVMLPLKLYWVQNGCIAFGDPPTLDSAAVARNLGVIFDSCLKFNKQFLSLWAVS